MATILGLLDPALVGFAPDTGQIAKGGSDILDLMRTHRDRIVHVHLKDWNGQSARGTDGKEIDASGYVNYEPIGNGVLPMAAIMAMLTPEQGFTGWINVELDGTPRAPRSPQAAAAMSRDYLGQLLGDQWLGSVNQQGKAPISNFSREGIRDHFHFLLFDHLFCYTADRITTLPVREGLQLYKTK